MMLGWGAFNVVEGVIDHQLFGLHHVLETPLARTPADLAFLAFGGTLVLAGWRTAQRAASH